MVTFEYGGPDDVFPEVIVTDRLKLERLSYEVLDVRELYEMYSELEDYETEFVRFDSYESRIEAKEYLDSSMEKFDSGESAGYAMFLQEDVELEGVESEGEVFVGTTGFSPKWDQSIAESGVFLLEEYWGFGFSTERGVAMLELAFVEFDFEYWISRCHPDNDGSISAIEKYVVESGGRRVGQLPNQVEYASGEYDDTLLFVLSCEDYFSTVG